MSKQDELLPCPFCGGEARMHPTCTTINCGDCPVVMAGVQGRDELAKTWNTRPTPQADEVKRLEDYDKGDFASIEAIRALTEQPAEEVKRLEEVPQDLIEAIEAVLDADITGMTNGNGAYGRHVPEAVMNLRKVSRKYRKSMIPAALSHKEEAE